MTATDPAPSPGPRLERASARCARPAHSGAGELARLVADAAGTSHVVVDEHCRITAIMVEQRCCDDTRTLLVELMENLRLVGGGRWTAVAIDELRQTKLSTGHGPTAAAAIAQLDWCHTPGLKYEPHKPREVDGSKATSDMPR